MLRRFVSLLGVAVAALGGGCAADDAADDVAVSTDALSVPDFFGGRIALARFYQHDHRTFAEADLPRKIAEIASLRPTWVSGLVRLDADDAVLDKHLAAYAAVRAAIPGVRVDVVLNAEQYLGPNGWSHLEERMRGVNAAFRAAGQPPPDAFFFDFYSKGKVDTMEHAAAWAAGQKPAQKIGGTFWATDGVPAGTDFLVLDDHDGLDAMVHQSRQLRARYGDRYPILAHVENNPGQPATGDDHRNLGLEWFHGKIDPKQYVRKQVDAQRDGGFRVMFPVDFPLNGDMDAWDPDRAPGYLDLVERLMK